MENDLISRKKVAEFMFDNRYATSIDNAFDQLKSIRVAYDVDKVMEKMEEHKKSIIGRKERDILNVVWKTNAKSAVERDIEILKSGFQS